MISRIIEVETSIILNITKTESNNCFIIHWTEKIEVIFFASSLTPSSTTRANLTWLLLEIMHHGHTWPDYPWPWHDYSWPWHDYCIICKFWRHGRWFRKFTVGFQPIKKELESWMYNNIRYLHIVGNLCQIIHVFWVNKVRTCCRFVIQDAFSNMRTYSLHLVSRHNQTYMKGMCTYSIEELLSTRYMYM